MDAHSSERQLSLPLPFGPPRHRNAYPHPIVIQRTVVTGFRHYAAPSVWRALRPGEALRLVREPGNAHDHSAVAVYWREHMLGYVPRADNLAVSVLLDRKRTLFARIAHLRAGAHRNRRLGIEIGMIVPGRRGGRPAG
jgi:hypothetical protein